MKTEAVLCASPQWTANSRQPYSYARTSHAAGRSLAYPLRRCASLTKISFKLTGRRCFCPPSTQSADRRAVFIGKGKAGFPLDRHFGNRPNRLAGRTPLPQKRHQVRRRIRFVRSRYLHSPFSPRISRPSPPEKADCTS